MTFKHRRTDVNVTLMRLCKTGLMTFKQRRIDVDATSLHRR